jgi:hypothetical protein
MPLAHQAHSRARRIPCRNGKAKNSRKAKSMVAMGRVAVARGFVPMSITANPMKLPAINRNGNKPSNHTHQTRLNNSQPVASNRPGRLPYSVWPSLYRSSAAIRQG